MDLIRITVFLLIALFAAGCRSQSTSPHWLTPPRQTEPQVLGQAPDAFSSQELTPVTQPEMDLHSRLPELVAAGVPYASGFQQTQSDPFMSGNGGQVFPSPQYNAVPNNAMPSTAADSFVDPWGTQPSVSVENRAKQEDEAREKARLEELAKTEYRQGMPDYLKPLNPWSGPFANRQRKKNIEQDIIRQVGYDQTAAKSYNDTPIYDWEKEDEKGFDWSTLDPANFVTKVRDWAGLGPDEQKANAAMAKGREILLSNPDMKDKKKCIEAAKHFYEASKRFPDSVLEEDALHLAGECYFFADDYPRAMTMYQTLLIKYQHSKHIDNDVRRLFKIGRYWEAEANRGVSNLNFTDSSRPKYDTFGYAKKAYETIFINDPNGPVSDDAMMALATAYLQRGKRQGDDHFNQAAYYYSQLRENYPLSKHIAKAHENELYARSKAYLGADHPTKSLEEAGKLADVTLQQFSGELSGEEKQEVLNLKEEVIEKRAEQLWAVGQFYDKKKRLYGAAKLYYSNLIDQYPQTEYAEKARQRYEQIKDLPEKPNILGLPVNPFKSNNE